MKLDRRRKYYMVLDCETATLPCVGKYCGKKRDRLALMKPLIYDLGWKIVDKTGQVYIERNFLVSEVFSIPQVFDTAYYKNKRPIYLEKLAKDTIILDCWNNIAKVLADDMDKVSGVCAYNASFDFYRAIPFTELYIKNLYSTNYYAWLAIQEKFCKLYNVKDRYESNTEKDYDNFSFREKTVPLFDLWGLSCVHILNNDNFRETARNCQWYSPSEKYFSTTAETTYRYLTGENDFSEAHTAIDDAEIETFIFAQIAKRTKGKWEYGIEFFPFRIVGKTAIW